MAAVKRVTRYTFRGSTYVGLKDIRTIVENDIGKILDQTDNPFLIPPKQRLGLLTAILKNRKELAALLTIEVEDEEEGTFFNIFDHKD